MENSLPIYIGPDAISNLIRYCDDQHLDRFTLVADQNTYSVLGKAVEQALKSHGLDVNTVVLTGHDIIADEHYIMQVLVRADKAERVYVAVGSGTITDIVRFVSHRTRTSFISVPTAPSVDGFTSPGAPLVIARLKQTISAQPPAAVFAHLPTLCSAPRPMIAAGFGDMLGKYTSLADWRLGQLLWDEPCSEHVAGRTRRALQTCVDRAQEIGKASEELADLLRQVGGPVNAQMTGLEDEEMALGLEYSHYFRNRFTVLKSSRMMGVQ